MCRQLSPVFLSLKFDKRVSIFTLFGDCMIISGLEYWQISKISESVIEENDDGQGLAEGIDDKNLNFQYSLIYYAGVFIIWWIGSKLILKHILYQLIYPKQFLFLLMFSILTRLLCMAVILSLASWIYSVNSESISQFVSNRLNRLTETVEATPVIIESRLSSLARQKKWVQVVDFSNSILGRDSRFVGSFKFWYYRALGECALLQIKDCEKSFVEATSFANEQYQSSIDRMRDFLQIFNQQMIGTAEGQSNSILI